MARATVCKQNAIFVRYLLRRPHEDAAVSIDHVRFRRPRDQTP